MKTISIAEFERFNNETDAYSNQQLPLLKKGAITLVDFLEGSSIYEQRGMEWSAISTMEFMEYSEFFKQCFPNGYNGRVQHEFIHGQVAERNGLKPTYCLLLGSDFPIKIESERGIVASTKEGTRKQLLAQPFVVDGVYKMRREWTPDRFFDYLQETIVSVSESVSSGDTILRLAIR